MRLLVGPLVPVGRARPAGLGPMGAGAAGPADRRTAASGGRHDRRSTTWCRTSSTRPPSSRRSTPCRRPAGATPVASACPPSGGSDWFAWPRPCAGCAPGPRCRWPSSSSRSSGPCGSTSRWPPGREPARPVRAPTWTRWPRWPPGSPPAPTCRRSGPSWPGSRRPSCASAGWRRGRATRGEIEVLPSDARPSDVDVSRAAVQLLTVHAAKGLEWDIVAVPGLVDGILPIGAGTPKHDGDAVALAAGQGRRLADDRQGRPAALRAARRRRLAAGARARLVRDGEGPERGDPGLRVPLRQLRRGRGAPAGVRRVHPGQARAAADLPRLGLAAEDARG